MQVDIIVENTFLSFYFVGFFGCMVSNWTVCLFLIDAVVVVLLRIHSLAHVMLKNAL